MTLPKAVVIGHRTWKIRVLPLARAKKLSVDGLCEYTTNTIWVLREGQTPHQISNTLRHEINHAAWDEAALGKSAKEEKAVTALANVWTQIDRDNPEVIDYLSEMARS
jgi:hypothetical protein